jgi:lipopolysaccharide export system protein LptC
LNAIFKQNVKFKVMLLVLAIVSLWLFLSTEPDKEHFETKKRVSKTTDYAMTDFTMTTMDLNGNPARIISGSQLSHYPKDDSTEIINPVALLLQQGKDTWKISSNKAYTVGKGDDLLLTGNVVATQPENPDIQLLTESLNIDSLNNTAYTDLAVTMKSSYGVTNSVGLHASLEQKTVNLHSRVKGHYDAPPTK